MTDASRLMPGRIILLKKTTSRTQNTSSRQQSKAYPKDRPCFFHV